MVTERQPEDLSVKDKDREHKLEPNGQTSNERILACLYLNRYGAEEDVISVIRNITLYFCIDVFCLVVMI